LPLSHGAVGDGQSRAGNRELEYRGVAPGEPEEHKLSPLQLALNRAAYRHRVLDEMQGAHPLARDEQIEIWCREVLERVQAET
jgi:hypothetical protein